MKFNNPVVSVLAGVVIFLVGAAFGGMYTKIQYLEGKGLFAGSAGPVTQAAGNNQQPGAPARPPTPTKVDVKVTSDDPTRGNASAKLTVVEFGDYQCPFCGRFHKDVLPGLLKDYVDTGKIKFVFKNLAFLGKESTDAANAALCAKEQNKFWEYHDQIYNNQQGENQGTFSLANLKKFAADLGLNTAQFNSCLDSQKYNAQVLADNAEAGRLGFNSTPSTSVGSTPVIGAQPYAQFKAAIDAELAKAK